MKTEKATRKKRVSKTLPSKEIDPSPKPPKSPSNKPPSDAHLCEVIHEPEIKYVFGRPTKYQHAYCKMLVEHMEKGYTFESFAGVISVNQDTLHEWKKRHPDFSEAYSIGNSKRRLNDERVLSHYTSGKALGSPQAIIYKFKAFHKMTDDVIGLRKLKMIQLAGLTPEQIKETALKLLKEDEGKKKND